MLLNRSKSRYFLPQSMLKELEPVANIYPELREKTWLRYGDWPAPLLRRELYAIGNTKEHFSRMTGLDAGLQYDVCIHPTSFGIREDHDAFLELFFPALENDPKLFDRVIQNVETACEQAERFSDSLRSAGRWDEQEKTELVGWYERFLEACMPLFPYSFLWYQNEKLLNELYAYALSLSGVGSVDADELKPELVAPLPSEEKSEYSSRALQDIMEMARFVQGDETLRRLFEKQPRTIVDSLSEFPELKRRVEKHVSDYGFLATRHWLGDAFSVRDVVSRIGEYISHDIDSDQQKSERELLDKQEHFERLVHERKLSAETVKLLRQIRHNIYLKTYRKELLSKVEFHARGLFSAIAARMGMDFEELTYLRKSELEEYLYDGVVPSREVARMRSGGGMYLV